MVTRVDKWGHSLAVRIPKPLAAGAGLVVGSPISLDLQDDRIIVRRIEPDELSLEELLACVTPENIHEEIRTGPARGREVW
jgi:antitoxin MazE